jgi:hypothetical protein
MEGGRGRSGVREERRERELFANIERERVRENEIFSTQNI